MQERTEWHRVSFMDRGNFRLGQIAGDYIKKGSKVYVEGSLRTREWEKDGIKRYTTEIIANEMQLLDGRGDQAGQGGFDNNAQNGGFGGQQQQAPAMNNMGNQGGFQQAPQQNNGFQQRAPQQQAQQQNQQPQNNGFQQQAPQQQQAQPQSFGSWGQQPQQAAPQQAAPQQNQQQQAPQQRAPQQQAQQRPAAPAPKPAAPSFDDFDDDIPF